MNIPLFLGILTLTPAVCGLIILALGLLRRATPMLALGIAALGALVPAAALLILAPYLSSGEPIVVTLFGGSMAADAWFSPVYRIDGFGLFAAFGLAFLVTPLLLWLAWRGATAPADGRLSSEAQWGGVALALGIESAGLTLLFADNLLWLSLAWLVLVALIWGLGEVGSDLETLDRTGLGLTLAGPVLWAAVLLLPALGKSTPRVIYPRLTDMMGRGGMSWPQVVALALVLAFAAGAFPFIVWIRRRAALITPAGLAALILALVPVAIFVGARTYSAVADAASLWPHQQASGTTAPPITAGIAFVLFGALTVGVGGLLALGRNDARALLAYLAVAQGGWGLIALGVGEPESILGVPVLLATTVLGGGAMLAALFAGGTLTSDIEPEGAGPRAVGMPLRPLHLIAWTIGAVTLVGAPLFGGFVSRQMVSAGALHARGLPVPLMGIAWAGDILLALALLRATAPAFAAILPASPQTPEAETPPDDAEETPRPVEVAASQSKSDLLQDEHDEEPAADGVTPVTATSSTAPAAAQWLPAVPGAIFAALALVVGIVPQALLSLGATRAAEALLQPDLLASTLKVSLFGYSVGTASWLPSIAWLAIVPAGALLVFLLPSGTREVRPIVLSGQRLDVQADAAAVSELPSPMETWSDLAPIFRSEWTLPASRWLLDGTEDDDEAASAATAEQRLEDGDDLLDADALDVEWAHEHAEVDPPGRMRIRDDMDDAQIIERDDKAESPGDELTRQDVHAGADAASDDTLDEEHSSATEIEHTAEPTKSSSSTPAARPNGNETFAVAQRSSRSGKGRNKSGNSQRGRGGRS